MIGTPLHFTEKDFSLHQSMCTLLTQRFGHYEVADTKPIETLASVIKELNRNLIDVLGVADQASKLAVLTELAASMASLTITATKSKVHRKRQASNKTITAPQLLTVEAKEKIAQDFYQELRTKLNHCHTQCATIFSTLHRYKDQALAVGTNDFHQACSYFNLLGNILSYNLAVNLTHPTYAEPNPQKINSILAAINNWSILLESYHLNYGENATYEALRTLFVQRLNSFKAQLCQAPEFMSIWPQEMLLQFSPEELEYHVKKKNERAKALGLPYNGLVVKGPANTVYMASSKREVQFFETLQKVCINAEPFGTRSQVLFYYNDAYGNVDVFDIQYNVAHGMLEIINIHPGNSCAQHDFLVRLTQGLSHSNISHRILACQAELGPMQQNPALYALRLSSLLSKHTFAELAATCTPMPAFYDNAHKSAIQLLPIAGVSWFPVNVLGDKAVLLNTDFAKAKTLLADKFTKYEKNYGLTPADPRDPEMLFTYADDYRQRLAFKYLQEQDFHGLSVDGLKAKLNADNNGQMVRRAAAGHSTSREFRFIVETFKGNPDNEACLHLPAKPKEYTPLQWALKERKASRAALLLTSIRFDEKELSEKNKDGKNAFDYFNGSKEPKIKQNPVLQRFLKR